MGKRGRRIERLTGSAPRAVSSEDIAQADCSDTQAIELLRDALRLQGRERVHALVRELLDGEYTAPRAFLLLDLYFDHDLLGAVVERIDQRCYGFASNLTAWCDLRVAPTFIAHARRAEPVAPPAAPRPPADAKRKATGHPVGPLFAWAESRTPSSTRAPEEQGAGAALAPSATSRAELARSYRRALIDLFERELRRGVEWSSGWDSQLHFDAVDGADPRAMARLVALARALPPADYEQAMRANLARCAAEPWRLARLLRPEVSDGVLTAIAQGLVENSASVSNYCLGPEAELCTGYPTLLERFSRALAAALQGRPCPASLRDELERATGRSPLFSPAVSIATAPGSQHPGDLSALAARLPGPRTRIYLLQRSNAPRGRGDLSCVGGPPPGAPPTAEGEDGPEPMVHVLTLDLARLPELAARFPQARVLSLYVPDPWNAERHEEGRVVAYAPGQLWEKSEDGAYSLEASALDVPVGTFEYGAEGALKELQRALASGTGYVGGGALMLHDEPAGVEPHFLFQFDESLCDINLGDSGVMYVWWNDVQWQCL